MDCKEVLVGWGGGGEAGNNLEEFCPELVLKRYEVLVLC